jgi:hypothetical protein
MAMKEPTLTADGEGASLAHVKLGDELIWPRATLYGPPVRFTVIATTLKCVRAEADNGEWTMTFRRSDGRVVGSTYNRFFVRPAKA